MITNIGGMIDGLSGLENIPDGLLQLKDLTEATRSVFLACAIGLGERAAISTSKEIGNTDFARFHDYEFELASIRKKVELLFAFKSNLKGDTILRFSILPIESHPCTGIWSTPVLYVCFALIDNALTACLQNKKKTSKVAPGNVMVNMELKDEELVISVEDDAGGLKGKQLATITKELYTGWSTEVGGDHSGMGLHIVTRIVEGLLRGTFKADDFIHPESKRVGARFTVRIPRFNNRL
jgi:signal transduction histidine kinase